MLKRKDFLDPCFRKDDNGGVMEKKVKFLNKKYYHNYNANVMLFAVSMLPSLPFCPCEGKDP